MFFFEKKSQEYKHAIYVKVVLRIRSHKQGRELSGVVEARPKEVIVRIELSM